MHFNHLIHRNLLFIMGFEWTLLGIFKLLVITLLDVILINVKLEYLIVELN